MSLLRFLLLLAVWLVGPVQIAFAEAPETKAYLHTEREGESGRFPSRKSKSDFGGLEIREVGGMVGVRDDKGEAVISFTYDRIVKDPYKPLFLAEIGSEIIWLDLKGNTVPEAVALAPTREKQRDFLGCGHGVFVFKKDELFGLRFETGRILIEPKYYALTCYRNGTAWGALEDIRLWCPIDPEGEVHVGPKCREDVATIFPRGYGYQYMEYMSAGIFELTASWNRSYRRYGLGKRAEPPRYRSTPLY